MKKILLLFIGVVGIVVFMYFSIRPSIENNKKYPVNILVVGYIDSYSITNSKNSESIGNFSEEEVTVNLTSGSYQLVFASDRLASVTKQIEVPQKEDEVLEVTFNSTKTAEETLKDIAGTSEGTRTTKALYFANNTWLVGNVSSTSEDVDTSVVVSRLQNGEWTTVESGTFIDTELLLETGAPQDLIEYIEGLQ